MEKIVRTLEAQLSRSSLKIAQLETKTQKIGAQVRFDSLMYIDELKALHVIAQSKLNEFRAAGVAERARLEAELKAACNELAAALKNPMP